MPRLFLYLVAAIVLVVLLNFLAPFYLESRPNGSSAAQSFRQEFIVKNDDASANDNYITDEELHKYDLSKIDGMFSSFSATLFIQNYLIIQPKN